MSSDKQQIAIAEACGWKPHADGVGFYRGFHPLIKGGEPAPDYLHDLNAMHEAEGVLSCHQFHDYGKCLERVLFPVALTSYSFHDLASFAHATAAQRAEAFLRTLGKWESP